MRAFLYISLALLFFSCQKKDEFTVYLAALDTLSLPLNLETQKASLHYDSVLFTKFRSREAIKPCGKIHLTDSLVLLVEQTRDDNKVIRIVTILGQEIDSVVPINSSCETDYGYRCHETTFIQDDWKIVTTDSTWQTKVNKGQLVEGTEHLSVEQTIREINSIGKISGPRKINVDSLTLHAFTSAFYSWCFDVERLRSKKFYPLASTSEDGTLVFNEKEERAKYMEFHFSDQFLGRISQALEQCLASGGADESCDFSSSWPWISSADDLTKYEIDFIDFSDKRAPYVMVSFLFLSDGQLVTSDDVAMVYFTQVHHQWKIDNIEVVSRFSLDNH